jgi:hypothetical protein
VGRNIGDRDCRDAATAAWTLRASAILGVPSRLTHAPKMTNQSCLRSDGISKQFNLPQQTKFVFSINAQNQGKPVLYIGSDILL